MPSETTISEQRLTAANNDPKPTNKSSVISADDKIPNMNNNSPSISNQSGSEIIKNLKRPPPDELSGESEKKIKKIQNNIEKSKSSLNGENGNENNISSESSNTASFENDEFESSNSNNINNTAIEYEKKNEMVQDDKHLNREGEKMNLSDDSGSSSDMPSTQDTEVKIDDDSLEGHRGSSGEKIQEKKSNSNINDNEITLDSDSSSDVPSTPNPEVKLDDEFLEGLRNGDKDSIQVFVSIVLKVLTQKNYIHDQFDSIINQILCEFMSGRSYIGGKCLTELDLLLEREEMWKTKYSVLSQKIKDLTRVVMAQQAIIRKHPYSKPVIITRTVALQANCKPKEDDEQSNIRTPVKPTTVNSATPLDPVNISDDDDEVIPIDDSIKPSTSNSEIIGKIPPNKKLPSPINKQATALLTKEVPPSVPIDSGTIDLTGNDDTVNYVNEVSTKLSLKKSSPTKPVQHRTINTSVTPVKSTPVINIKPKPTKNLPSTVISANNVAYLEIPSTSSPGLLVRTSLNSATPTVRPAQLSTVTNLSTLNSRNLQTSGRQFVFKNGQLIPVQLSVAPMATTPQQIQPRAIQPRAISAFIRQPAPSLAPLQPVPPGIPLITQHPAPTPSSIQRHCSSWKKLPPAPELTVSRANGEDQQGLVLSWTFKDLSDEYAEITYYQIYAYHEIATDMPKTETWKKIGDVNALPLPMACSLTQFISGEKYHFAVRAVDKHKRYGPFSTPKCQFMV